MYPFPILGQMYQTTYTSYLSRGSRHRRSTAAISQRGDKDLRLLTMNGAPFVFICAKIRKRNGDRLTPPRQWVTQPEQGVTHNGTALQMHYSEHWSDDNSRSVPLNVPGCTLVYSNFKHLTESCRLKPDLTRLLASTLPNGSPLYECNPLNPVPWHMLQFLTE